MGGCNSACSHLEERENELNVETPTQGGPAANAPDVWPPRSAPQLGGSCCPSAPEAELSERSSRPVAEAASGLQQRSTAASARSSSAGATARGSVAQSGEASDSGRSMPPAMMPGAPRGSSATKPGASGRAPRESEDVRRGGTVAAVPVAQPQPVADPSARHHPGAVTSTGSQTFDVGEAPPGSNTPSSNGTPRRVNDATATGRSRRTGAAANGRVDEGPSSGKTPRNSRATTGGSGKARRSVDPDTPSLDADGIKRSPGGERTKSGRASEKRSAAAAVPASTSANAGQTFDMKQRGEATMVRALSPPPKAADGFTVQPLRPGGIDPRGTRMQSTTCEQPMRGSLLRASDLVDAAPRPLVVTASESPQHVQVADGVADGAVAHDISVSHGSGAPSTDKVLELSVETNAVKLEMCTIGDAAIEDRGDGGNRIWWRSPSVGTWLMAPTRQVKTHGGSTFNAGVDDSTKSRETWLWTPSVGTWHMVLPRAVKKEAAETPIDATPPSQDKAIDLASPSGEKCVDVGSPSEEICISVDSPSEDKPAGFSAPPEQLQAMSAGIQPLTLALPFKWWQLPSVGTWLSVHAHFTQK